MPAIDLADVVNAADVAMRNLPGHAHFSMKAGERGGIGGGLRRMLLAWALAATDIPATMP